MWHSQRRTQILSILRDNSSARTADIVKLLKVSRETVRRDLLTLEAEGLLARVHGGAVAAEQVETEASFQRRRRLNWPEKLEIGRRAVELLSPGMIVWLDAGTTTLAFAEALRRGPKVQVITNSISVAQLLGPDALLLGGRVLSDVPAVFGEPTLREIERFIADFAIISPTALHPEAGVTYYELHESEVARAMCAHAQKIAVLANASKLGITSRVATVPLTAVDYLVTGSSATEDRLAPFAGHRLTILRPGAIRRMPSRKSEAFPLAAAGQASSQQP